VSVTPLEVLALCDATNVIGKERTEREARTAHRPKRVPAMVP
jgi:hypothetical protein